MCKQPYQPLGTMATEVYSTEGLPVDVNNTPPDVLALATAAAGRKPRCDKPIKCPSTGELCERWTPDEDQRLLEAVAEFGNAFASISRETFGGRAGRSRHACRNRFQLLQGARNNRNGKMAPAAASAIVSHSTQLEAARETLKVNKEAKAERKQQRHSSYRGGSSSAAYMSNRAAPRRAAAAKAARWAMEEEDDEEEERLYDMSEVEDDAAVSEEEEMVEAAAEVADPTHDGIATTTDAAQIIQVAPLAALAELAGLLAAREKLEQEEAEEEDRCPPTATLSSRLLQQHELPPAKRFRCLDLPGPPPLITTQTFYEENGKGRAYATA